MNLQRIGTPEEIRAFETAFDAYLADDIMRESDLGEKLTEDDLTYFRSDAYRNVIAGLCARHTDPAHRFF